jgi:DNA recombination protein RmuC
MDISTVTIGIILIIGIGAVIFFINKKISELKKPEDDRSLLLLQQQMNQLSQTLDKKLSESFDISRNQFQQSSQFIQGLSKESRELLNEVSKQSSMMIRDVTEKLTKLDETNRQVVDFSSQLKNLQDILRNPKQRGVLGEYYLEETLKNVLPPNSYQMQYKFKDGTIVDAAIFLKEDGKVKNVIPVDSKFSLETYEKILNCSDGEARVELEKQFKSDLKNRIDETSKYIKPSEKTTEFALMFIPSESIYYDLLVNRIGSIQVSSRDLIEYAFREKRVVIVSPTTFFAYLQSILQGLNALKIQETAKEIQKFVERLGRHLKNYDDYIEKVGINLTTTVNSYNKANKEFAKINKDVLKITGNEDLRLEEHTEVNKPKGEEE